MIKTVIRPSRSGGPKHVMTLDASTGGPVNVDHPCSCAAGAEGRWCWAILEAVQQTMAGTQTAEIAAEILAARQPKGKK